MIPLHIPLLPLLLGLKLNSLTGDKLAQPFCYLATSTTGVLGCTFSLAASTENWLRRGQRW